MNIEELKTLIRSIVKESCKLKDKYTDQRSASVNYACIFSQSQEEYDTLIDLAKKLGKAIKESPTGPLFHIDLDTASGKLRLLKIRRPDRTRPERGDADFTVDDYLSFKKTHLSKTGFSLIKREDFEMIELADSSFNVRTYFSNPPLDQQLGI